MNKNQTKIADRLPVIVVDESDSDKFEERCKRLHEEGYLLQSSSCGFANSEAYDYCTSLQAIWALPGV